MEFSVPAKRDFHANFIILCLFHEFTIEVIDKYAPLNYFLP